MATAKITITLPDDQILAIRERVARSQAPSISGFIQSAVQRSLQNSAEFSAMIDQALEESGGPLTPRERAWAKQIVAPRSSKRGKNKPRKAA